MTEHVSKGTFKLKAFEVVDESFTLPVDFNFGSHVSELPATTAAAVAGLSAASAMLTTVASPQTNELAKSTKGK